MSVITYSAQNGNFEVTVRGLHTRSHKTSYYKEKLDLKTKNVYCITFIKK